MKLLFTLLVLLIPPLIASQIVAQTTNNRTNATVVVADDGDTVRVNRGGQVITVRLACIDAPEIGEPQGSQSAERLRQLIPRNTVVQLRTASIGRYNQLVAEVYRNGASVNLQMVQEGRAIVDRRLLYGCMATRDRYLDVEQVARQRRLALWSRTNPVVALNERNDTPIYTIQMVYPCDLTLGGDCPERTSFLEMVECDPEWDRECPYESGRRLIEVTDSASDYP
ncbi:thermonuclease family protein [Oscillatoria sp. FACHB-1407]|uniref:thermonuclease family protein n=1 Tax=Oscillatoria sp. FACHB-1407 TaxID=2692847 RepID=UPI0016838B3E|nr:thermonuclease family protein [Oscillatoria sp. FACHB-1407]MBD2463590.1 thermonuclease family protein [Oscillatoria sp. FACHB-1407]